jgi:FAD/FMN-containing dehydrogenase
MRSVADQNRARSHLSRRAFVAGSAAAGLALITPLGRVDAATAQAMGVADVPPDFPPGITLYTQTYQNWAQQITVEGLWTAAPQTAEQVVTVANWAAAHGYRIRARGMMHGWSPLTVTPTTTAAERIVLLDTTQHLTGTQIISTSPAAVRVQAGTTMDTLLEFLEQHGLGVTAAPAPGDITIGGALAIDAHGTAIRATGEEPIPGHTYGSLSNLIISLTAVVWNPSKKRYVLRRFDRSETDTKAFLVHLGRTFVTEVELRVGANVNLRCQSYTDIPVSQMFAAPGAGAGNTLASFLEEAGRVEAIWYPFTTKPWLKVWSVSPSKPSGAVKVSSPYNYVFSDEIPVEVSELATKIINGEPDATPTYGNTQYDVSVAGLAATNTNDIWGASKNLLLYIKPTTIRETANGYTVQMNRANVQRAVSEFAAFFTALVASFTAKGDYPINMPVEIRVTGRDEPGDVQVKGASSPVLSALHPRSDHPDWDASVWFDVLTFPLTPTSVTFYRRLEQWFFSNFRSYGSVRTEWSKGWAYSQRAAWSDRTVLRTTIPSIYRTARKADDNWDWALATYNRYDPHRIFTDAFHDLLMPR